MPVASPAIERFWPKVAIGVGVGGCWLWTGAVTSEGYGQLAVDGRRTYAHRFSYETFHRMSIPEGLELDHLCRVRSCVNPYHLEPVTRQTNVRRGAGFNGDSCQRGHPYTEENTYIRRDNGVRMCRACQRRRYDPAKRHERWERLGR